MTLSLRKIEEAARAATEPSMSMFANGKDFNEEFARRYAALADEMDPATVLALVAVVRAAMELSAVSGLRAEYMQDELSALNEAVKAFEE